MQPWHWVVCLVAVAVAVAGLGGRGVAPWPEERGLCSALASSVSHLTDTLHLGRLCGPQLDGPEAASG